MAEKIKFDLEIDGSQAQESIKGVGDEMKDLKKNAEGTSKGVNKIGKGAKALGAGFKALGIGLVIAAFAKLSEALGKNQKFADGLTAVMTGLGIAFSDFVTFIGNNIDPVVDSFKALFENPQKAVKDFADTVKKGLIDRFNQLLEVFGYLGKALRSLFAGEFTEALEHVKEAGRQSVDVLTGVDGSLETITESIKSGINFLAKYASEVAATAQNITQLENKLKILESQQQLVQLTFQKDAELQRQIRDDVSLTFDERKKANDALGVILDEQLKQEQVLADFRLKVAKLNMQVQGNTTESQERYNIALGQQAELAERIVGQQSEQLTNTNSLILEQRGVAQELALVGLTQREKELQEVELWYSQMQEKARINNSSLLDIQLEYLEKVANVETKYEEEANEKRKKQAEEELEIYEANKQARLSIEQSAVSSLNSLATLSFKNAEKAEKFQKGVAIAQLAIDTARSISSAIAGAQAAALATGPAAPFTAPALIAGAIATTLGAFVQAKQILNKAKGPSAPSLSAPSIPSGPQDQSNAARGIDIDTENEGSGDSMITKTYVLSKDVSSKQELDAAIKRESVI